MGYEIQPDWYADPTGIHNRRYWDGAEWTAHVADRFGATSMHHLQDRYAPPGTASPEPVVAEPAVAQPVEPEPQAIVATFDDDALPTWKTNRRGLFRRKRADSPRVEAPVAELAAAEPPEDLGVTTEAETHVARDDDLDDALMLAAQTLQVATEQSGFSWRDSDMTIDDAINALPVDIADNTVSIMHRLFATAGDTENAAWTEAKLREIKMLKRGYRKLHELVSATPRDEVLARARAYGVPDDLTEDFVAGMLQSEIPTVGELLSARLPVDGVRPA